jgi:uncharacterized membrane protein YebE (DUF533 family)
MDENIDENDPYTLTSKLSKISCILGLCSVCYSSAEYWYQKDRKNPDYIEARVKTEAINKNVHYCITAIQTMISVAKIDLINSKNQ